MNTKKISTLLLSLLFLFCFSYSCLSQDQLIFKDGTQIKGSALTINKSKVRFENAYTGQRKWHNMKQIEKLIDKQDDGALIEYEARDIKGISSYLSGALIIGKASLFIVHKATPGYEGIASFIHLHREGESQTTPVQSNSLSSPFYKRMAKYFSDCPEVALRIKEKKYKTNELSRIIDDYNSICGKG